jgi:NADH-quinone oxidoreductase subunit G
MPLLKVNGKEIEFEKGMTVLQACELAGEEIPRFCYHERLKIAGNCRMCLVQIEGGPPKPAASCAMPAGENMVIHTNTPMVQKAREGVMEFLLMNHPLDCPICDQAGECDLQDQAMAFGRGTSRYKEEKRAVKEKEFGPLIKTEMTRCIQCTRCVRFMEDVAGSPEIGATGRGENMEIGTFIQSNIKSNLSGNIIDLCPVGALTNKPNAFKARSWEMVKTASIDITDAVGSNTIIHTRGNEVFRILPDINDDINEEWISDKARFFCDGLRYQRLDRSYIRQDGKLVEASLDEAITFAANILKNNPIAISGDLTDMATQAAAKALMEAVGGAFDCRYDGTLYNPLDKASYVLAEGLNGLELADKILIIAANPQIDAPLLNTRILKSKAEVGIIGSDIKLNYKTKYLGDIIKFDFLKDAKNPHIILGNSVFTRADIDAIVAAARAAGKVNALPLDAARVGGLDIGFVSGDSRESVFQKLDKAGSVLLLGSDSINITGKKVVYIGHHGDTGASIADVVLPAPSFAEKTAFYTSLEGRLQKTRKATMPLGDATLETQLLTKIAGKLGVNLAANYNFTQISERPHTIKASNLPEYKSITTPSYDFYQTNVIAKNSPTMAECSKDLV